MGVDLKSRLARALPLALTLCVALSAQASADQGELLGFAKSSSMTENTTNVINGTPQPGLLLPLNGAPLVVRSVPLGTINAGETIEALSEVEVTNDLVTKDGGGANVFHDVAAEAALIVATSPTGTTGIELAEAQGSFVTPQVHHWTFEKSGTLTASQQLSGRHLNLVMSAHSPEDLTVCWTFPRSSLPNPQVSRQCGMDVNYNRGHLSALRFGPAGVAPAGAEPFSVADFSGQSLPEASPSDAPITYSGQPPELIVALARPVGALEDGDLITAHSEIAVDATELVRTQVDCNVGVATRLFLSPDPDSFENAEEIGTEGGNNLTGRGNREIKTLERGVVPSSTTVRLDQDYAAPMYVLLRLWTIGNSACALHAPGIRADLDQAGSFMHVVRYRPEPDADLVLNSHNSGDDSEQAGGIDVITEAPVSVYSQRVDDLAPGDRLEALSEFEVSTADHRAAVHSRLIVADGPAATTGTPLQPDSLTEVNPYMHRLPIHHAAPWTVPAGVTGTRYVNLVVWGEHLQTLGTAPDDEIELSPDAGRLVVQQLRPVDNEPPDGSITAGPSATTADATPSFSFGSSEPNSSFECRLDSAGFLPCDSPHTTAGLADGSHRLEVRAVDRAGNSDPTPPGLLFTVDTRAPETSISGGPPAKTRKRKAAISFGADDDASSFRCSLDGAQFAPCVSPLRLTGVGRGPHTFLVRATDPVGNADASPARRSWKVMKPKRKRR